MIDRRVVFDFEISFANGGGVQGQEFRFDIDGDAITDEALAEFIVDDLRLLMVSKVTIVNKRYVNEPHKRKVGGVSRTTPGNRGRLVDLSHPIVDGMTTYPGLPGPSITTHMSREDSRTKYAPGTEFFIGRIDLVANTGTYLDAPFHRYDTGTDIGALSLQNLVGLPGVVVDSQDTNIGPSAFADVETWGRAVLIRTGWSRHFGQADYLGGHPYVTEAGAQRLVEGGARLVGIDSANIDETSGGNRPAHSLLLANEIPIVEHLTGLEQLPRDGFEFFAIPAPVKGMGTFPVRAVARFRVDTTVGGRPARGK